MKNNTHTVTIITVVALLGAFVFWYTTRADLVTDTNNLEGHHAGDMMEHYEMYPGDVVERIENNKDVILLDVRTPEEYEEIHLRNAQLLPVQELSAETLAELGLGEDKKDAEIIVYCRSGARSQTAYNIMSSLGYTNVKSIAGGIVHWQEDNYPLTESGPYMGSHMYGNDASPEQQDSARIELDETFHDFGVVPQYGGVVEKKFTVTNTGTQTLEVGDLTTSCSCTTATISSSSIEPGKQAELAVMFDPDFHEEPLGVFKRTVFIPTNDPQTPEVEVVIQVDIAEGKE